MKLNKFLKIFVVCFCLVALFTVSCFATSAQTTNAVYYNTLPAGTYVFDDILDFSSAVFLSYVYSDFSYNDRNFTDFHLYSDGVSYFIGGSGYVIYSDLNGWVSGNTIVFTDAIRFDNPVMFQWFLTSSRRVDVGYSSIFSFISDIFVHVGVWISNAAASLTSMFFADGSLTFLGVLCIASLAMAISFLLIVFISRFLRFRA